MKSIIVFILISLNLVICIPDSKWHESDDGSKFYIETTKNYNWYEAWSDCARKNMSLIAIDTYNKHQQIDNLLRKLYKISPILWLGAHDNAVALHYEWASTGQPFTFTNWAKGQPADKSNKEHCILIWSDFQWHDDPCRTKKGYICEEHYLIKNMDNNCKSKESHSFHLCEEK